MENTSSNQERRSSTRQRMLKSGTVSPDGRLSVFDCVVKNMSETGARIKVQAQQSIPNELIFMLKGSSIKADARVIWRHEKEIGLQFISG
ncbi:MAG: PilZ domain-containing protein [Rhizobiaceae bacterium]